MLRIVKNNIKQQSQSQQIQIEGVLNCSQKHNPLRKNVLRMTIKQPNFTKKFASQSRKQQRLIVYVGILIATVMSSGQSVIQYNTPENWASPQIKFAAIGTIELFQIIVFLVSLLTLVQWRESLRLCLLVDNILAAEIATIYVLVTLTIITNTEGIQWNDILSFVLTPISLHLQSTNFRALCLHVKWNRPKVVFYKLFLLAMTIFYLGHGCYFFIIEYKYTGGSDSSLDQRVFEFMVLYTCTNFAYCLQLFSKLTDIDGTADMKSEYYLQKVGNEWILSQKEIHDQKQISQSVGAQKDVKQGIVEQRKQKQFGVQNDTANDFFRL